MGKVKLSKPQEALLKRIRRCPKGCYIEGTEKRSSLVLQSLGLITLDGSGRLAYPVEAK